MEVAEEDQVPLLGEGPHQPLDLEHHRVEHLRWRLVPPIQVAPAQRAPVVPIDHPVRIYHRHDLEHELLPQDPSLRRVTHQKVDQTLHHPGRVRLPWVHPRRYQHPFLVQRLLRLRVLVLARDSQVLTLVPSQCPAQSVPMEKVLGVGVFFDGAEVIAEVGVGEGEAVGEVDLVQVRVEFMDEGEGVVIASHFQVLPAEAILVVKDVAPYSMPSFVLVLFGVLGEGEDLHAVVVEGVGFGEVDDVEADFLALPGVGDPEEVPLGVAVGVDVVLQDEVVLIVRDLQGRQEVPTLKSGLKDDCPILLALQLVIGKGRAFGVLLDVAFGLQLGEVVFALDVVVLDELLHIDQVRRRPHRGADLRGVRHQYRIQLPLQVVHVLLPEPTVHQLPIPIHLHYLLRDRLAARPQLRRLLNCLLVLDEAHLLHLILSRSQTFNFYETEWTSCSDGLLREHGLGNQFLRRRDLVLLIVEGRTIVLLKHPRVLFVPGGRILRDVGVAVVVLARIAVIAGARLLPGRLRASYLDHIHLLVCLRHTLHLHLAF
mmetsp:Transcript_43346/g.41753  ORF Transcript_43346/g.41753 Transcript_43346/m.41753 type:complete len:541 (-) Transcript_43346:140-1762(-)